MVRFNVLEPWHDPRGGRIERLQIDNGILALEVLSLGGIIRALWAPDPAGERRNLILGCNSAEDYLTLPTALGAVIANNPLHRHHWQLGALSDGARVSLTTDEGMIQLDYRLAGNNLYLEVTCQGITLQRHNMLVNLNGAQPSASLADHHLQINQQGTLTDYPLNDALLAPEPQTDMQLQHQATLYATQSKRALVVYSNCPQLRLNRAAELEGQATHRCRDFSRDIAFGLQPQFAEQPEQHTPLTQLIRYQFDNL